MSETDLKRKAISELQIIAKRYANRLEHEMQRSLTTGNGLGYRQLLTARDRLEESVMWAVKGISG